MNYLIPQAAISFTIILAAVTVFSVILSIRKLFSFKKIYKKYHLMREKMLLRHQQHSYRASLEERHNDVPELLVDSGTLTLRGLFFFEDLLKRHSPRRKKSYIEPLRYYRLCVLQWSDERAAREARI